MHLHQQTYIVLSHGIQSPKSLRLNNPFSGRIKQNEYEMYANTSALTVKYGEYTNTVCCSKTSVLYIILMCITDICIFTFINIINIILKKHLTIGVYMKTECSPTCSTPHDQLKGKDSYQD